MTPELYHVRYKQDRSRWEDAYFTTEDAADKFVWTWREQRGLAEYKGRREGVRDGR